MNGILLALSIIGVFSAVVIIAKLFGKEGLTAWAALSVVLANILVTKQVTIFGIDTTMANVLFSSVFLCTDILSEVYGKKDSKRAVNIAMISALFFVAVTQVALRYIPNAYDVTQQSMETLFTFSARTTMVSVAMFYVSNLADVYLFDAIKNKIPNKLWLRNNVCTILCNCLENFAFSIGAFLGFYDLQTCLSIAVATCIFEVIIGFCDTPFVYLGRKFCRKE